VAVYHLSVKTFSRSRGQSATAAAAYRAGAKIVDHRTGEVHDYCKRKGVVLAQVVGVDGLGREDLWNLAEQEEKRKNSTVAREWEVALPVELNNKQRAALALDFSREIQQRHQVVVDCCIHSPRKDEGLNFHAHILTSTRRWDGKKFTEKARELDDKKCGEVEFWRARWAALCNEHLQRAGKTARVDHRSYQQQGRDIVPQPKMGVSATALERRGQRSRRGDLVRAAHKLNQEKADMEQQIRKEKVRQKAIKEYYQKKRRRPVGATSQENIRICGPGDGQQAQQQRSMPYHDEYLKMVKKLDGFAECEELGRGSYLVKFQDGTQLVDNQTHLVASHAEDNRIAARHMLDIAEAKGWTSIQFWGPEEWRKTAIQEAVRRGMPVVADEEDRDWLEHCQQRNDLKGCIIEHGVAPYLNNPDASLSYFVTLQTTNGEATVWGVDLQRAVRESNARPGDQVLLQHGGKKRVEVTVDEKDETGQVIGQKTIEVDRNTWQVEKFDAKPRQKTQERTKSKAELMGDDDGPRPSL
jgi:hypothetical protein